MNCEHNALAMNLLNIQLSAPKPALNNADRLLRSATDAAGSFRGHLILEEGKMPIFARSGGSHKRFQIWSDDHAAEISEILLRG